jgi:hypothetical protein
MVRAFFQPSVWLQEGFGEDKDMIRTDDELNLVRKQLELAETALLSLRRDVLPKSVARYNLMAENYVDQINELRSEIEEYLGIAGVADTAAEVVIGAEAPASDLAAEGDA